MSIPEKGHVEIDFKFASGGTEVTIDGVKIPCVVEARIGHRAGDTPRLFLEILPERGAKITGEAEIVTAYSHDSSYPERFCCTKTLKARRLLAAFLETL